MEHNTWPETEKWMRRCLELALMGQGYVAPNPMVGAVLVHEGRIIGEGYHKQFGEAHAEVNCLQSVAAADRCLIPESTLYVSLEPCAHTGKTPSCAKGIVQAGIQQVIVSNKDPFEKVNGSGFEILSNAGVKVSRGLLEEEGKWINRRFFCFHQKKRPYIILKWAQTSQGLFAPLNRGRVQLSNVFSKQLVHKWRASESAILVGTTTALHDNPQLTARCWEGRQPLRIVLDEHLALPDQLHMFCDGHPTWIINRVKNEIKGSNRYIRFDFSSALLQQLLQQLYDAQILSLIVEGGAHVLRTFIEENLWDEARIFETTNVLTEGVAAPSLTSGRHAFSVPLASDRLHIYTNGSALYVNGLAL